MVYVLCSSHQQVQPCHQGHLHLLGVRPGPGPGPGPGVRRGEQERLAGAHRSNSPPMLMVQVSTPPWRASLRDLMGFTSTQRSPWPHKPNSHFREVLATTALMLVDISTLPG